MAVILAIIAIVTIVLLISLLGAWGIVLCFTHIWLGIAVLVIVLLCINYAVYPKSWNVFFADMKDHIKIWIDYNWKLAGKIIGDKEQ